MPGERPLNGTERLAARVEAVKNGKLRPDSRRELENNRPSSTLFDRVGNALVNGITSDKDSRRRSVPGLVAGGAALAAGIALAGVEGITWRSHRELTHNSIKLGRLSRALMDLEQLSLGIKEPSVWAAVHRIHHQMTDASLYPFWRAYHAIQNAEASGMPVPEKFKHMDPFVDEFSRAEVEAIGLEADKFLRKRMGEKYYRPPIFNGNEGIHEALNPESPRTTYWYPDYKDVKGKKVAEDFTSDEFARVLTTDPHSPALVPPKNGKLNGVRGIGTRGAFYYLAGGSDMFYAVPDLKPEDLQTGTELEDRARKSKNAKLALAARFAIPAATVLFARGDFSPKGFAIAGASGTAIGAASMGLEVAGGMAVNSLGHAGVLNRVRIIQSIIRSEYQMQLNPDGSLSTNTLSAGPLGRILSWATLDEVGKQDHHHRKPGDIAYTDQTGWKAVLDAPWGSLTSYLAHNKYVKFIQPGDGFEGERPDMPHEGVMLIRKARMRQMAEDSAKDR